MVEIIESPAEVKTILKPKKIKGYQAFVIHINGKWHQLIAHEIVNDPILPCGWYRSEDEAIKPASSPVYNFMEQLKIKVVSVDFEVMS